MGIANAGARSDGDAEQAGEGGGAAAATPASEAGSNDAGAAGADQSSDCGNGAVDPGEECDDGDGNRATNYGDGKCTDTCEPAPRCGDGKRNGPEACDNGGTGAFALGDCNPKCSGFYEKKLIRRTDENYTAGGLGGIPGADAKCASEFGAGWKALLVGGTRRATKTPMLGDEPQDWVIHEYTYYYADHSHLLVWRTDGVALLGVRDGKRIEVYSDAFLQSGSYPWSGWKTDWTTFDDVADAADYQGTCNGWTSSASSAYASFAFGNLTEAKSESCGSSSFFLCVQQ